MKIIRNEKLIKRNGRIGGWLLFGATAILFGGLYLNINSVSKTDSKYLTPMLIAFAAGILLMQIALYFVNRYGGNPRKDQILDTSLKGLPGDYTIYHFTTPAAHLLVGPAGIWALFAYRQRGVISYQKNRWRIINGGFLQVYMSILGGEGIGRPDLESENEIEAVKKLLAKTLSENEIPNVRAALIFYNDAMEIQTDDAPIPALKIKQLKDFIRQKAKEKPIGQNQLAAVKAALPE